MVKLSDFLTPLDNFQYSINLEFDLNDNEKISSYVPTGSALGIIDEILDSTMPSSKDRARILTGAYGKGKSHLTLAIVGLLSGKKREYFTRVIEKAIELNEKISNNLELFFKSKVKLLPVLLNSQNVELKSTILQGLSRALERESLNDLMPTTFFDAAISKIDSWRVDYPKTYEQFSKKVGSVKKVIDNLNNYDDAEYNYFKKIYPSLTSGSEFNPLQGADVISILDSVVEAIKEKGYSGIFIVYDEFSKFLDGHIEAGSAQNIKLLQDLAERCNRSGETQIHMLLISHKNIENYVGNLPKKSIDDWRGISKRFKPLTIESSDAEIFDMIASVLKKDEKKYDYFMNKIPGNKEKFKQLKSLIESTDLKQANKRSAFSDVIKHTGVNFVEKCYPLHPYTLLLLPKVSELVAQNERTIFTFLASEERHGVKHYMRTEKNYNFPLIEADKIYDFFEQQFRECSSDDKIRYQWEITSSTLMRIAQEGNVLSEKILKSISLIYIINQFDILPPSLDLVYEIYSSHSLQEVNAAVETIRRSGLLLELEYKPHVRIRDISGNNAEEIIQTEVKKLTGSLNIREALQRCLASSFLYPVAYNEKYEMTRYFQILFVDYKTLKNIENIKEFISGDRYADGFVFAVIINDEIEREECLSEIRRLENNRVIYALPKAPIDISKHIIKYTAIQNVLQKGKDFSSSTIDEFDYILTDLRDLIDNYINVHFFNPEHQKTEYYYENKKIEITRRVGLSVLFSDVCEKVYNKTPIIINENINREILSSPMKATRKRILESVLQTEIVPGFGLQGSQDINVVRSVYVVPNIVDDIDNPSFNTSTGLSDNFISMFDMMIKFIESAAIKERSFSALYKLLKDPDEGFALRGGVIPFYFIAALNPYKSYTIIKRKNKEIALSADVLEQINDNPDDFSLLIESWNEEKSAYIAGIEKPIYNYVSVGERDFSSFNYIVKALQKWYLHLSRFDRDTKRVCDGVKYRSLNKVELGLKKLLSSPEINAHEFLFIKLPGLAGTTDYTKTIRVFQDAVFNIENNTQNVIEMSIREIKNIFTASKEASLSSTLMDYYEDLNERTKQHVFSGLAANLLDIARQKYRDDGKIAQALVRAMLGLRLDDFNDLYADRIIPSILEAKEIVDNFNNAVQETEVVVNDGYEIAFINPDGNRDIKHISTSLLPTQARSFSNEIETLFDEYGEALSTPQKAQVILEVLKKLFK